MQQIPILYLFVLHNEGLKLRSISLVASSNLDQGEVYNIMW